MRYGLQNHNMMIGVCIEGEAIEDIAAKGCECQGSHPARGWAPSCIGGGHAARRRRPSLVRRARQAGQCLCSLAPAPGGVRDDTSQGHGACLAALESRRVDAALVRAPGVEAGHACLAVLYACAGAVFAIKGSLPDARAIQKGAR